jgi:hypothetical protein
VDLNICYKYFSYFFVEKNKLAPEIVENLKKVFKKLTHPYICAYSITSLDLNLKIILHSVNEGGVNRKI